MKPDIKPINPAHIGLPRRPQGNFKQYHHSDTEEAVRAAFIASQGASPEVVQLIDLSTTENPNPCWIAGPVHSNIEEAHIEVQKANLEEEQDVETTVQAESAL